MKDGSEFVPVGFFRAAAGVFCGTAAFNSLVKQPLWRVLWHMFMFTVLCGLLVTLMRSTSIRETLEPRIRAFDAEFGGVSISDSGVSPLRDPERSRVLPLWNGGGIIYAPAAGDFGALLKDDWHSTLLWTPGVIALAASDGDRFYYMLPLPEFPHFGAAGSGSRADMLAKLSAFDVATTVSAARKLDLNRMLQPDVVTGTVSSLFFISFVLTALVMELILTSIFGLVYRFVGARPYGVVLNYGELFRIGVYAGFPALAVAGLFPAFELPLLNFDQAYSLGLVAYMLVVITEMTRRRLALLKQDVNKDE